MIIDCAHYTDGARQHEVPLALDEVAEHRGDGFVWLGLLHRILRRAGWL